MNAEETKLRGVEYCNKHMEHHNTCWGCPLHDEVCINRFGEICSTLSNDSDFVAFSKSFNKMIKELYKDEYDIE